MIKIYHANDKNCQEILDLQKLCYREEADSFDDYSIRQLTETLDELRKEFCSYIVLKAVCNRKIVGSVAAYKRNQICHIEKLMVHPDYQNRGIGKQLISKIEQNVRNVKSFELVTGERSTKNIFLCMKMDYHIHKKERLGSKVNVVFLEKTIGSRIYRN